MTALVENAWLVVAVPFGLALLVGLTGRILRGAVPWVTLLAPLTVLATGVAALSAEGEHADSVRWLFAGEKALSFGWSVDGLTAIMLTVVGFVATMVVLFSIGYMHGESGLPRYFASLSLFTGSMALLLVADGLVGLFVGWELVGACSYLLIGFWFRKPSAAAAAVKAFLTTRVGDVGLLLGLALLWRETGQLGYSAVFEAAEALPVATVTTVAILLFVGAMGKSAQFPLHIWLPDAMEGPTPVSALIHAATMVAAGVFLVARMWPLYELSETAQTVILVIGVFTALASATVACAQRDIKKVLAYSTISQLGFMFAALGAGAWVAAIFHLVTHAAFKALLFLGSGSVIHGTGTQDLREMGGLAKKMPVTALTWVIGSLALAGVAPLAGFFSKDEVIHAVLTRNTIAGLALLAASLLTAFYITRATRLAFFGEYRGDGHPHEGGLVMSVPLIALAVPAATLGFAGHFIAERLHEHAESLNMAVAAGSLAVAAVGIGFGLITYRNGAESEVAVENRMGKTWETLRGAYGFDAAVSALVVRPVTAICQWLYDVIDRKVIDASVESTGRWVPLLGRLLSSLQNGDAQWYAALLGAGVVGLIALLVTGGR